MTSLLPTTPEGASAGAELVTADGRTLPLRSSHLRAEAQGGIARLVLEQRFENAYAENLRVVYRMPLPADGAVSGYAFEIGGRTITGVVDRKQAARATFERAIARGYTAALLEQERADIFTQQIGNLPPHEAVIARIRIDLRLAWLPEGEWELRFPTVIGPRYIGSADTAADARATHVKVAGADLGVRLQIELAIGDPVIGAKPSSPSHALATRADGVIELRSTSRLDRDLVVRWRVATPAVGITLAAARPASGGEAYGLLAIVPPAREAKVDPVPRDLIVLLDTSGSMSGGPLAKAKQVVGMLLDSLGEQDRFELIEFSDAPVRHAEGPLLATPRAKQEALRWLRAREAGGATEMREAVLEALTTLRIGAQRQVVVVTDGYVGGEQQILAVLHERLPRSCRLHVLGVGSAVNRSLAAALARAGRGAEVIVGVDEDAERGAKRLLDRTRMPVLTNLEIEGSAVVRHAPEHAPDVFEGAPLVAALMLRPEGGEVVVRGQLAHGPWEQRIAVPPTAPGQGNAAIVALYARERVADLEARSTLEQVDREVEDLGVTYQIATRLTSWVAVDETRRVSGPTRTELVPEELPHGTVAGAFGLRAAAAQERDSYAVASSMAYDVAEMNAEPIRRFDEDHDAAYPAAPEDFGEEVPTGSVPPPPQAQASATVTRARSATAAPAFEAATTGRWEAKEVRELADQKVAPAQLAAPAPTSAEPAKPARPAVVAAPEPVPAAPRRARRIWLIALLALVILALLALLASGLLG